MPGEQADTSIWTVAERLEKVERCVWEGAENLNNCQGFQFDFT